MCGSQKFGNVAVVRWHNNENNEVAPFVYLDEKRQRLPQLCCRHVPLRPQSATAVLSARALKDAHTRLRTLLSAAD